MRQVLDEVGACLFSNFIHVHIHRGDAWFSEIGERISVKSHDSHVFRDPNTLILHLLHHAEVYHAVCTEYGPGRLSAPRPRKNWPEGPTFSAGRKTRSVGSIKYLWQSLNDEHPLRIINDRCSKLGFGRVIALL